MGVAMRYGTVGRDNPAPLLILRSYKTSVTVSGNAALNVSASDLGIAEIPGYRPVATKRVSIGSGVVVLRGFDPIITGTALRLRNTSSSSATTDLIMDILFARIGDVDTD